MELKDKKINFLGDSITEGAGTSDNSHRYPELLMEMAKLSAINNYGISGTCIAQYTGSLELSASFAERFNLMDNDADIIVVFGGTNDYGHGTAPIGQFCDRESSTFYGACHKLFEGLIQKYPSSEIIVLTPLHRGNENSPNPFTNEPLERYVDIIIQVAEWYALPVLDLYRISGIQPEVQMIREKMCPDALHPNDAGHKRVAERLYGFLKAL